MFGFPARAARAMIYKKPLAVDTVGKLQKVNSLLSISLMGLRRGLRVVNFVRSVLKTCIQNWSEVKFSTFLYTPVHLGGFGGFGERIRLFRAAKSQERYAISTITPCGISVPSWVVEQAIYARAIDLLPVPGIRTVFSFEEYRGPKHADKHMFDIYAVETGVRLIWSLGDLRAHDDAYILKLFLDAKYMTHIPIVNSDLPNKIHTHDVDRSYRMFRRYINYSISMDSVSTIGESYAPLAQWAHM